MHLAVCDDNIADRKQMERLLGRESDRRLNTTGVLYVDSFGNREAILSTPMIYDGLFIDMKEEGNDAVRIANLLRQSGAVLPIVFCCSSIDYRTSPDLPDNCFFLDKPIVPAELSAMCDQLLSIKNSQVKRFEFRSLTETYYLEEKDIMYAWPEDDQTVRIRLVDGTEKISVSSLLNFCANLGFDVDHSSRGVLKADIGYIRISPSGRLAMIGCTCAICLKYVTKIGFFALTMADGRKFRIAPSSRKTLLSAKAATTE
ncbi:MAG TPA: response regulator [Candidatus Eisenbergiella intestinipullorum]|nr:response regulator [Candidatus Eisenbergiella intestinipullorum]